jgi:hypothetical protein
MTYPGPTWPSQWDQMEVKRLSQLGFLHWKIPNHCWAKSHLMNFKGHFRQGSKEEGPMKSNIPIDQEF